MGLPACAAGLKRPSKALQWSLPVGLSRQCLTSLVMVAKVMGLPAGTAGLKRHIRITMEFASWTILPVPDISRYGSEGEDGAPTPPAPVPASPHPVTLTLMPSRPNATPRHPSSGEPLPQPCLEHCNLCYAQGRPSLLLVWCAWPAHPQPTALGMQASQRCCFGFLQGEQGLLFVLQLEQ